VDAEERGASFEGEDDAAPVAACVAAAVAPPVAPPVADPLYPCFEGPAEDAEFDDEAHSPDKAQAFLMANGSGKSRAQRLPVPAQRLLVPAQRLPVLAQRLFLTENGAGSPRGSPMDDADSPRDDVDAELFTKGNAEAAAIDAGTYTKEPPLCVDSVS